MCRGGKGHWGSPNSCVYLGIREGAGKMASQGNFVVTNMDTQMFWGVGLGNVGVNFRESHRG